MKLIYLGILFIICSCSSEVEIFAPYEENASVIGLLDPSQPIQYIKINKIFVSQNTSASVAAKMGDSLYFDSLTPKLTEIETGRIINLYRVNNIVKDQGYFANYPNYLYMTKEKIYANDPNNQSNYYHYKLDINLPGNNKHISAITNIPDSTVLNLPIGVGIGTPLNKEIEFIQTSSIRMAFQAPENSMVFDSYFIFNYLEINKNDTNKSAKKVVKIRLIKNYRATNDHSREVVSVIIRSSLFYDNLLSNIPIDTFVIRKFQMCSVELTNANLEFDKYTVVNEPAIGIVQKQTDYTNIMNGTGIFASRRISRYNNIKIGPVTRNTLITNPSFKILGFSN